MASSSNIDAEPPQVDGAVEELALSSEDRRERFALDGRGLREHTARGVMINSAFQVGFAALNLLQRFAVAVFLTRQELGVWGLVLTTVLTLSWLKQIGISDKYIQQDEADQELAFQKAFTLELAYTLLFCVLLCIVLPLYGLLYGRSEFLVPSLVIGATLLVYVFASPTWIAYREMRFLRQRVLEGINPVVSTVVMIPLAAAGAGYWSIVIGVAAGAVAWAVAAMATSPYKLALRYDPGTMREYVRFSWPLLASGGAGLLVVQGTIIVANFSVGLAGLGAFTLASSLVVFAQRVDGIISTTIYPAVCAIKDRTDLMLETFIKSNRLALMWGLPFGIGLFLFGPDLVEFVLGNQWRPAVELLQGLGLIAGIRQLGFNWSIFYQARGETRPMAVGGLVSLVVFLFGAAPAILLWGLPGIIGGMSLSLAGELAVRAYYMSKLFEDFRPIRHLARAVAPSIPAVAIVVAMRLANGEARSVGTALAEFAAYLVVTIIATLWFERGLFRELAGYIRASGTPGAEGV